MNTTQMKLTADNVRSMMEKCLFAHDEIIDGKIPETAIQVQGIMNRFAFHPGRIKEHTEEIKDMLRQLPPTFSEGWSFLNACMTKDNEHWAEHPTMDMLFSLGQATGNVACCLPREMWTMLPGGMPYYQTKDL